MKRRAAGESSALFLVKAWRGLKRVSCLLTVWCCRNSLSFLMILLTKDFTGSRKFWHATATFCRCLPKISRMARQNVWERLRSMRSDRASLPFEFYWIFSRTNTPTLSCCSTRRLKTVGLKSAFAVLSRYLLTSLKVSLRKSVRVPGRMQACLKMISTHFSRSPSAADRSRMFFSLTITHIFRFHPCVSLSCKASPSGTLLASRADRQLLKASGKMGMAQVQRNLSSSLRKKPKSSPRSRSWGQSCGKKASAAKTRMKTASMTCASLPERRADLLAIRAFSPACISRSIVFFSNSRQQSSRLPMLMYHPLICPSASPSRPRTDSSRAAASCVWCLASCSLRQNSSSSATLARIS